MIMKETTSGGVRMKEKRIQCLHLRIKTNNYNIKLGEYMYIKVLLIFRSEELLFTF